MFHLLLIFSFIYCGVLTASVDQKCDLGTSCMTTLLNDLFKNITQDEKNNLDPIYHKVIEGKFTDIKYVLTNTTTAGFTKCDIKRAQLDLKTSNFEMDFYCPALHVEGQYEIDGTILTIPVTGNGDYTVDAKAYNLSMTMGVTVREKNDKHHMHIDNFKLELEPLGALTYNLTNLFNGQKDLGDDFLKFANANSKIIAKILQEPIFQANFQSIVKSANNFMKKRPMEEFVKL